MIISSQEDSCQAQCLGCQELDAAEALILADLSIAFCSSLTSLGSSFKIVFFSAVIWLPPEQIKSTPNLKRAEGGQRPFITAIKKNRHFFIEHIPE